ncbi:hypothetical protein D5086_019621 [Populus alba]|uniref:Uncharacterized protein n=1 Tax=Populus alba TaxID=43335 RepID=A0ACC4BIB3_POPAL
MEREEMDGEDDLFEAIEKLINQGINAGDVKKLQDAGIYTCNGLMMFTKKHLTGIKGLSEAKVDKICEAAEKIVNYGYITGSDALLKRKSVIRITTGSQALDELLGGGIETSAITEAFGEFRSGKTQLAHTLCVSTQLPTQMHGGNGKVAYIDTEGTFRPDRIVPIAERFGMDPGAVLDNIIYARAYTYEHQYNLLLGLAAKMSEEPYRLLIVDSVIALFRVDFTGRGELAERQQKLAQMLSRLIKIAEEFNVAVYMTNQVIADPGGGMFISDPKKPAGGHVLAHAATIRLMFRKGKGEQRYSTYLYAVSNVFLMAVLVLLFSNHMAALVHASNFLTSDKRARREIKPFGSMAHPSQAKPNNIGALHCIIPCFNSSFLMKLAWLDKGSASARYVPSSTDGMSLPTASS